MIIKQVNTSHQYKVCIGRDILSDLGTQLSSIKELCTIAVITDDNVAKYYLETVLDSLNRVGYITCHMIIKSGEAYKNTTTYLEIIEMLASNGLCRSDVVLSLGGGVVSDMAGFASASYLRGIDHMIVPTTLLSIIDASIGGKTGVDLEYGKNLLGAFHQPKLVYIDIATLDTLTAIEYKSGIGEGIKYALLSGGRIYAIMQEGVNSGNLLEFISLCVDYKIDIVTKDTKESGDRKLLNLGHTFGHAIESLSNYSIPHGVAISLGIEYIINLNLTMISDEVVESIKSLLKQYDMITDNSYSIEDIYKLVAMDKKRGLNNTISLVVLDDIGSPKIIDVPLATLGE